jgi:hypothetical protein
MEDGSFIRTFLGGKPGEAKWMTALLLLSVLFTKGVWGARADSAKHEPKVAIGRVKAVSGPPLEVNPVPYPNGAIYVSRGLSVSFIGGKHINFGDAQSLFQWQGEVSYFYTPYFSGGAGFRIRAGEPSAITQKVQNRYFLLTRFHKAWKHASIYMGTQLGLDNLNILSGVPPKDSSIVTVIKQPIRNTNAGLGLDAGAGWAFSKWVGLTLGGNLEYSLVGEESGTLAHGLNLHALPGISLDLLNCTHTSRDLVQAAYLFVEFQAGLLIFEKKIFRHDIAGVTGISVAF